MKIAICGKSYEINSKNNNEKQNLLSVFMDIKRTQNPSLGFRHNCKSGVCGSCAIVVNGVEKLACKTFVNENDEVAPLKNLPIIKDLVVDIDNQDLLLKKAKTFLKQKSRENIAKKDVDKIDLQSNCILCSSCFSSCPVYEVNSEFIGPFALARAYRYVEDKKELDKKSTLEAIQDNGIWDCTLCGNCSVVCPAHIDIKNDIMNLRNISVQNGYENKAFAQMPSGMDFGFNPNF